jgi:hypothetical protein
MKTFLTIFALGIALTAMPALARHQPRPAHGVAPHNPLDGLSPFDRARCANARARKGDILGPYWTWADNDLPTPQFSHPLSLAPFFPSPVSLPSSVTLAIIHPLRC